MGDSRGVDCAKVTTFDIIVGDCLETMRAMPDASVHAIVTDPPYGISFMGKGWDSDVPPTAIWSECLRVLKPGGHLLSFAGTRTQHRMATRIEEAGFEIRDVIAWVYGSGFPKSLDVSKAIDKMDASEEQERRRLAFTAWVRSQGVTSRQIDEATGTNMGGHYTTGASQPAIMTREHLEACRNLFREVPQWVEREADIRTVESRNMAEREVVGTRKMTDTTMASPAIARLAEGVGVAPRRLVDITAPATEAARQWQGWGTALKPAMEPITVARKPLVGTVAENVLAHGTGGVNVDGCRVGEEVLPAQARGITRMGTFQGADGNEPPERFGRWPANLIHDGSHEALAPFPGSSATGTLFGEGEPEGAARFFYCAKPSRAERGDNSHPTVKPIALMRYLCRLVTPKGGTVLDPFAGSGTTGVAAIAEGFSFVGCELSEDYAAIARRRMMGQP